MEPTREKQCEDLCWAVAHIPAELVGLANQHGIDWAEATRNEARRILSYTDKRLATKFRVEFDTNSAAFEAPPQREVCRILRRIVEEIEQYNVCAASVEDINGNTIGDWGGVEWAALRKKI